MSGNHEGDGWWIASDGNWYPPDLHPSVRGDAPSGEQTRVQAAPNGAGEPAQVGPQFPDLFQKAMQGNHLADNVSVKYDGDDQRNLTGTAASSVPHYRGPSAPSTQKSAAGSAGGPVGDFMGATATKRSRWRRH